MATLHESGPEIAAKAWQQLRDSCPFVLIGDPAHLPRDVPFAEIENVGDAVNVSASAMPILRHVFPAAANPGLPAPENAASVVEVIQRAVSLVMSDSVSAICTAPISKKELVDHAAFQHPGHTEFLAALAEVDQVVMMLAADELKVVPTTIHMPLSEVACALDEALLDRVLRITRDALRRDFGIEHPRIAVAGLNPHAGEGGMLGKEDGAVIAPVCAQLRAEGFKISGPLPADTMFHADARARYDVAVAMYHDQALIPIKTFGV